MIEEIKYNTAGKIQSGESKGWFIYIQEDFEKSGGYIIIVSRTVNFSKEVEGYDYWAKDRFSIEDIFKEAEWMVHWLNDKP